MRNLFFFLLFVTSTAAAQVGLPDVNFGINGVTAINLGGSEDLYDIKALSNGKILCLSKSLVQGTSDIFPTVCRLNPDGSLDPTYGTGGFTRLPDQVFLLQNNFRMTIDAQQRALIAAHVGDDCVVYRLTSNGALDTGFSFDGKVTVDFAGTDEFPKGIEVQTDGKIVVACEINGDYAVARLNNDGTFDTSFGANGKVLHSAVGMEKPYAMTLQADDKILVTGTTNDGVKDWITILRLNTDGSLDNSFSDDGLQIKVSTINYRPFDIAVQPDGKIVVVGGTFESLFTREGLILRYNSDGMEDLTFDDDGLVEVNVSGTSDWFTSLHIQPDGKILAAGNLNANNAESPFWITRHNANGGFDTEFSDDGWTSVMLSGLDLSVIAMDMLPNGDILIGSQDGTDDSMHILKIKTGLNIGVNELEPVNALVYPNPTSDFLKLDLTAFESRDILVEIIDVSGSVVLRKKLTKKQEKLDVLNLVTGIYTIRLTSESQVNVSIFNKL